MIEHVITWFLQFCETNLSMLNLLFRASPIRHYSPQLRLGFFPAQDLLRLAHHLTVAYSIIVFDRLRHSMLNCFSYSRVDLGLLPHCKRRGLRWLRQGDTWVVTELLQNTYSNGLVKMN